MYFNKHSRSSEWEWDSKLKNQKTGFFLLLTMKTQTPRTKRKETMMRNLVLLLYVYTFFLYIFFLKIINSKPDTTWTSPRWWWGKKWGNHAAFEFRRRRSRVNRNAYNQTKMILNPSEMKLRFYWGKLHRLKEPNWKLPSIGERTYLNREKRFKLKISNLFASFFNCCFSLKDDVVDVSLINGYNVMIITKLCEKDEFEVLIFAEFSVEWQRFSVSSSSISWSNDNYPIASIRLNVLIKCRPTVEIAEHQSEIPIVK